jgi:hypothetical protein
VYRPGQRHGDQRGHRARPQKRKRDGGRYVIISLVQQGYREEDRGQRQACQQSRKEFRPRYLPNAQHSMLVTQPRAWRALCIARKPRAYPPSSNHVHTQAVLALRPCSLVMLTLKRPLRL